MMELQMRISPLQSLLVLTVVANNTTRGHPDWYKRP